jgi:hypothetical protein
VVARDAACGGLRRLGCRRTTQACSRSPRSEAGRASPNWERPGPRLASCGLGTVTATPHGRSRATASAGQPGDAAPWYARACERGYASACYELAVLHENGLGVARNPERAFALYKQACTGGDTRGCPKSRER